MSGADPTLAPSRHRRSTREWRWPALGALAAWLLAAVLARRAFTGEFDARAGGYDFRPLYDAALAARVHAPLYAVYNYVYPPAAAFAAAPLTLLSWHHALLLALAVEVGALVATCAGAVALVTARERRRWVPAVAGLAVAALFTPLVTARNLDLANTSLLLPLVVLATCWLWGRGHWHAGTALLVASLVIKPLLLTLVLLPLARGRIRPLLVWGAVGGVITLAAVAASTGIAGARTAADGLLHATHFTGAGMPLNISLAGVARLYDLAPGWLLAGRLVVAAAGVAALVAWRTAAGRTAASRTEPTATVAAGTALLAALFLASSISEGHYVYSLLPGVVVALTSRRALPTALAAASVLAFEAAWPTGRSPWTQGCLVSVQVLALAACTAHLVLTRRGDPTAPPDPASAPGPRRDRRPGRRSGRPARASSAWTSSR